MAESGSPGNSGIPRPSLSLSTTAPPDWEMLTMSMSASALGKPDLNNVYDMSNPQVESPNLNEGACTSDVSKDPLHASVSRDTSNDVEAEPFTEGWKPYLSASSGLYGDVADQNHQEEPPLSSEGAETFFDSNDMNIPKGLHGSERDERDRGNNILAYCHSFDDFKSTDEIVQEDNKCKRRKGPKMLSAVVWSIAVVAGVAGIVVLGSRLHLAYKQNQQIQIQISEKNEKLNEMLLQVNRLKEVLGNHHRVPVSRN